MDVVINGVSARIGGGVTFIRTLASALGTTAPDMNINVLASPAVSADLQPIESGNVKIAPATIAGGSIVRRLWFEQIGLPRLAGSDGRTGLISPANICCFRWPGPQVMVVQSIAPFLRDAQRGKGAWHKERYPVLDRLTRASFRTADIVIAPSQATRDLLVERGCPPEKLKVIGLGRSEIFAGESSNGKRSGGYLLTVGALTRHKNLGVLIEAVELLREEGFEWPLRIVGPSPDSKYFANLQKAVFDRGLNDLVSFDGPMPYEELPKIYKDAGCYVLPSLVENFPHTLVEAMSVGCPIVSARQIPTQEICGDAALEVDARDARDVARGIKDVMTDNALSDRLSRDGIDRSDRFDWLDLAEEYANIFRELDDIRSNNA